MNFIHVSTESGDHIATIASSTDPHTKAIVGDLVMDFVNRGFVVSTQAKSLQPQIAQPAAPASAAKSAPTKRAWKRKEPFASAPDAEGHQVGDRVRVEWDSLTYNRQQLMQHYRMQQGVVTDVKRGKGVRQGIAVEFPAEGTSVWFGRNELSKVE